MKFRPFGPTEAQFGPTNFIGASLSDGKRFGKNHPEKTVVFRFSGKGCRFFNIFFCLFYLKRLSAGLGPLEFSCCFGLRATFGNRSLSS